MVVLLVFYEKRRVLRGFSIFEFMGELLFLGVWFGTEDVGEPGKRTILEREEAFKVWVFLHENPFKIEVVPLSQLDILKKDFRGKKIEQVTTTALGSRVITVLEFKDFREDTEDSERFFIEIEQNHERVWTQKSFLFGEILGMEFV